MTTILQNPPKSKAWWRYGYVWLVIAGPAVVVVAGFYTLWLAISSPDPVLSENYYQQGIDINKTLENQSKKLLPALKGRNHAATPAQDTPSN